MEKNRTAYEIITLDHNIRRFLINEGKYSPIKNMPSQVQMRIVHYLIQNKDTDIYQRDLEDVLMLRRATVSGVLQTMERNGLVKRVLCDEDVRCKKIILNEKAKDKFNTKRNEFYKLENIVKNGLNDEEIEFFCHIIKRMQNNIKEYAKRKDSYV